MTWNWKRLGAAVLGAFTGIFMRSDTNATLHKIESYAERNERTMATLVQAVTDLQADDTAVIAALNKFAQQIADFEATGADPAQVAALEQVHADFLAALNVNLAQTKPAIASQTTLRAAGIVNPVDPRAGIVTNNAVTGAPVKPPKPPTKTPTNPPAAVDPRSVKGDVRYDPRYDPTALEYDPGLN